MDVKNVNIINEDLTKRLENLESRISILEQYCQIESHPQKDHEELLIVDAVDEKSDGSLLESRIGESGLAWLGNIVLFFGVVFLVQYIQKIGFETASTLLGFVSVAGVFALAYFLKEQYHKMASIFTMNAWLLLFYVALRLHFFSETPIILNNGLGLLILILVVVTQLVLSIKKKSVSLVGIGIVLLSIIAILSDSTHLMLPIAVSMAIICVVLLYRFGWIQLVYLSIFLVYLISLIWIFNNPIMGHPLKAITAHNNGIIYLFLIGTIYSVVPLIVKSESISLSSIVGSIILNGLGFSTLLLFFILSFFLDSYVLLLVSISVFCILYSVLLKLQSDFKIVSALYALYGFITFSIAVHGFYAFPMAYFILAIQSIAVVSMAIWFRSKFIVVMNAILFIILLIFYLQTNSLLNGVNISFSLAALLTARILNWKKDRLTIKTDLLRNIYLFVAFVMVLITLYNLFPARYITLSWTAAAVLYFGLSLALKNIKYRYLALGTMLAAAFYLFIIDLARIELVFRILALMFLAFISIGLSIYYSRKSKKRDVSDQ